MENEPQRAPGAPQGLPCSSQSHIGTHPWCPGKGQPLPSLLPDPKAPNTHIPKSRRMRHPALAVHTGKNRAGGWWIPRVLVLIPAHWKDQTPQHLQEPTQTPQKSHKPHGAFSSKQPKSHLSKTSPLAQEGPSDLSSLGKQHILNQPVRSGTRGRTHPSAIKFLYVPAVKLGEQP